ncbi:MAG: nickel insertion protein [Planctomycetota bacterium]
MASRPTVDPPHPSGPDSPTAVVELVVNLDDATPEVVGDATQTLMDGGALDVWATPIQMKKQRPGVMLSVLCLPEVVQATARRVMELTGSFGVRFRGWDRLVLEREHVEAETRLGPVSVKLGRLDGELVTAQPEFDAVRALADSAEVPVRVAMDAARAAADRLLAEGGGR